MSNLNRKVNLDRMLNILDTTPYDLIKRLKYDYKCTTRVLLDYMYNTEIPVLMLYIDINIIGIDNGTTLNKELYNIIYKLIKGE